jgi:glycosyltransferase involved in cell wall biosynthesis
VRLLLINQYFPPDHAPTGLMLEAVVGVLVDRGHEVTVLCAKGGYAGTTGAGGAALGAADRGAVPVVRIGATRFGRSSFLGKLADYLSFYLGVALVILRRRPRPDRVVVLTTPPYLSVLARLAGKGAGADHAHWVMDLYPDVMVAHGMLAAGGLPHRVLAWLARLGFGGRRCAGVMTLGPDMAARVSAYLPAGRKAEWVPLWNTDPLGDPAAPDAAAGALISPAELAAADDLRSARGWKKDELVVMYSGNMGLGHRFSEILEVVRLHLMAEPGMRGVAGDLPRIRVVFYGGGKRRREIEEFLRDHPAAPVELHDYVPRDLLAAHLRSADVHLASLESGWEGTMVPSKLQGIFAVGRPVFFVGSETSSIGEWIQESSGGWVVAPGDHQALHRAILEAALPGACISRGRAAGEFARRHFDRQLNSAKVAEWMTGGCRDEDV